MDKEVDVATSTPLLQGLLARAGNARFFYLKGLKYENNC